MKSFFALLCVILAIFPFAQGKAAKCKIDGHVYKFGQKFYKRGQCLEYTCNGQDSFNIKGCSEEIGIKKHCKYIPQDNCKPYPQCCAHYKC